MVKEKKKGRKRKREREKKKKELILDRKRLSSLTAHLNHLNNFS